MTCFQVKIIDLLQQRPYKEKLLCDLEVVFLAGHPEQEVFGEMIDVLRTFFDPVASFL